MLVAGFVRFIVVQHVTFSINSLSHWWGRQPWSTATTSRDNRWLALLSFGEGYHNFHHTFQADYRNGIQWYDYDPSKWLIRTVAALGLASDLRRTPEHLLLRARFEQGRSQWRAQRDALRTDLAQALADAELRMERSLGELRARTHAWGEARREGATATTRELERRVREAARDAREGLAAWERLARSLSAAHVP
jgi:stearoyl-CoA desaturase (delta-9 desaturase)